jgi:hypothetical protein
MRGRGSERPQPTSFLPFIHPSAWNRNSRKSEWKMSGCCQLPCMNSHGSHFAIGNSHQMPLVFAFVFEDIPEAVSVSQQGPVHVL